MQEGQCRDHPEHLWDDLKIITGSKHVSLVDGLATFGGHEVTPKMTPIELFMAGDVLFCSMVIGKEGCLVYTSGGAEELTRGGAGRTCM